MHQLSSVYTSMFYCKILILYDLSLYVYGSVATTYIHVPHPYPRTHDRLSGNPPPPHTQYDDRVI